MDTIAPTHGGKAQGPRSVFCYICSRPFGSKSIKIHEPQCLKKWRAENEKLPKKQRRPEPHKPTLIETGQIIDYEAMNQMLWEASQKAMLPCGFCHRTFANAERLEVHQRSCAEYKKFKESPDWSSHGAQTQDSPENARRTLRAPGGGRNQLSREPSGQSLDVQKRPPLHRRSISERHKREHPPNNSPPPSPRASPTRGASKNNGKAALAQRNVSRIPERKKSPPKRSTSQRRSSSLQNIADEKEDKKEETHHHDKSDHKDEGGRKKSPKKFNKSPKICKKCSSPRDSSHHDDDCGSRQEDTGESGGENECKPSKTEQRSNSNSPAGTRRKHRSPSPSSSRDKSKKSGEPRGAIQREESSTSSTQDDASIAGTNGGSSTDGGSASVNVAKSFVQKSVHAPTRKIKPPKQFRN